LPTTLSREARTLDVLALLGAAASAALALVGGLESAALTAHDRLAGGEEDNTAHVWVGKRPADTLGVHHFGAIGRCQFARAARQRHDHALTALRNRRLRTLTLSFRHGRLLLGVSLLELGQWNEGLPSDWQHGTSMIDPQSRPRDRSGVVPHTTSCVTVPWNSLYLLGHRFEILPHVAAATVARYNACRSP